jgi:hypothetical protein
VVTVLLAVNKSGTRFAAGAGLFRLFAENFLGFLLSFIKTSYTRNINDLVVRQVMHTLHANGDAEFIVTNLLRKH